MPIDTSMYSMAHGFDLGNAYSEGMKLNQQRDEARARKKQQEEQQQIDRAYGSAMEVDDNGNTVVNQGKAMSALAGLNNQSARLEAQNIQQQQAQMKNMSLDQQMKETSLISQALGGVDGPQTWDLAKASLKKAGVDIGQYEHAPYDPKTVDYLRGATLTAKDRLAQMNTDRDYALKKEALKGTGGGGSPGKAPPGYRFTPDGSLEPIPGGPAAQAAINRKEKSKQDAGLVVQDIGRSLSLIEDSPSAAGTGDLGLLSYVPGSPTQQLDSLLDSVKANIGFNKLQAMREASPTGGALGSVSEKETAMLQATAGKLSSNMPEDQLKDNLKRLYNQYNDIIHGPGKGPARYQLSFDEQGRPAKNSVVKEGTKVVDGITYKKVDGGWEEIPMPASR